MGTKEAVRIAEIGARLIEEELATGGGSDVARRLNIVTYRAMEEVAAEDQEDATQKQEDDKVGSNA